MSGSDDRYFNLTTDFGKYKLDCPSTGSFSTVGTIEIHVDLKAEGSLTIGSDWYGPDLDKIEVFETKQFVFPDREYADADKALQAALQTRDAMLAAMSAGEDFVSVCARYRKQVENLRQIS